jgi:hypothetical protein
MRLRNEIIGSLNLFSSNPAPLGLVDQSLPADALTED